MKHEKKYLDYQQHKITLWNYVEAKTDETMWKETERERERERATKQSITY